MIYKNNFELKAHMEVGFAINICSSIGAKFKYETQQTDTFYITREGRLKKREYDNMSFLIYYNRLASPNFRESSYLKEDISNNINIGEILDKSFGTYATVKKTRRVYMLESTIINIDKVDDLGEFIEFEIQLNDNNKQNHKDLSVSLLETFGINPEEIVPFSYADLLLIQKQSKIMRDAYLAKKDNGKIILVDGVSCSGKTSITQTILDDVSLNIKHIPRYTTRSKRLGVKTEDEYVFVSREDFLRLVYSGSFIEYRDFDFGMSYGLPWKETVAYSANHSNCLGVINLGNAQFIKKVFPEAILVLIDAPINVIKQRLIDRKKNTPEQINERLNNAKTIDYYKKSYDYIINNDNGMLDKSISQLKEIVNGTV